eukprot:1144426-Pelagomonas_calceolata.AAC.2
MGNGTCWCKPLERACCHVLAVSQATVDLKRQQSCRAHWAHRVSNPLWQTGNLLHPPCNSTQPQGGCTLLEQLNAHGSTKQTYQRKAHTCTLGVVSRPGSMRCRGLTSPALHALLLLPSNILPVPIPLAFPSACLATASANRAVRSCASNLMGQPAPKLL